MKKIRLFLIGVAMAVLWSGCTAFHPQDKEQMPDWKSAMQHKLPLLGHRNWILIVDKAFPDQATSGIETINTGEQLIDVVNYVKSQLDKSPHISPIIYQDKELQYINNSLSPGIEEVKSKLADILKSTEKNTILHEDIFRKIDDAAKMFTILVLKTEELHPYTSVFMELDCAYWNADKERTLRERM